MSLPPANMDQLHFVVQECGCTEDRAKKLLAMNNGDAQKAIQHQTKLTRMLTGRGHSQAQPRQPMQKELLLDASTTTINTINTPTTNESSENNSPLTVTVAPQPDPQTTTTPPSPLVPDRSDDSCDTASLTLQEWDFRLPSLPEEDASDILKTAGNVHAQTQSNAEGEEPEDVQFNLRELCAALQQGAPLAAIRTYLKSFPAAVVEARLDGTVEGFPSIFYAVGTNNPAILRLWINYGADVSVVHRASGTPLLAYAIAMSEELGRCGKSTESMVATLLSLGAPPQSIPDAFYRPYDRDLEPSELVGCPMDGVDEGDRRAEWQWCRGDRVRRQLVRTAHLTQRYYLDRATYIQRPGVRHRQVAALGGASSLLGLPYFLVGQTTAAQQLMRKLMTDLTVPRGKPLVLVFAGPSGHGKTELARQLDGLLGLGLQLVDCTIVRNERELFGPRPPYVGSDQGNPLNNFLSRHSGQRSIVFLDEFEKTSREIHESLLLPFDRGTYQDRRNLQSVDCSRTIWILATNALYNTILQFCDAHPAILQRQQEQRSPPKEPLQELTRKLASTLRSAFLDRFGAPITGRVSEVIPILPFSPGEQAVVAHKFLAELADQVATPVQMPPQQQRLFGNVRLRMPRDASLCHHLADIHYSEALGARSLRNAVDDIQDRLVESYLDNGKEIAESDNMEDYVVDVRDNEVVVLRSGRPLSMKGDAAVGGKDGDSNRSKTKED